MMKKVLVIGLGASGVACVHFLSKRGYEIIATDTRETPASLEQLKNLPNFTFTPLHRAKVAVKDVNFVVISPGVSPYYSEAAELIKEAEQHNIPWFGEIELFAQEPVSYTHLTLPTT